MREGFQRGKQLMNFDQSDPQNEVSFVGGYFISTVRGSGRPGLKIRELGLGRPLPRTVLNPIGNQKSAIGNIFTFPCLHNSVPQ